MTSTNTDLLRLLGGQAVPGLASAPAQAHPSGSLDFARLLEQAKAGALASGREVTMARNAGVTLSDEQMKRLSAAADLAESQGATRALVMMDGLALKLDIGMREITGVVDLKRSACLTGIDAVIQVPGGQPDKAQPPRLSAALNNSSLLSVLAQRSNPAA
jgi:hypothetical protein